MLQYMLVISGFPAKRNVLHWCAKSYSANNYARRSPSFDEGAR